MNTHTTEPRNRVYPASEGEILAHPFDSERIAYSQTRDALPRYADRYVWDEPDPAMVREGERLRRETRYAGEPASGKKTAGIVGTLVCGCLLLAGLAYLAWAGSHGGYPWTR